MSYREELSAMFDYDRWANLKWLPVAIEMGEQNILLHILNAQIIWLSRIEGTKPWEPSLDEFALHSERSCRSWKRLLLGADLQRVVPYISLQGVAYNNSVSEIVRQVVNHGTYHRGQLRGIAGERGIDFPETDFIVYVRASQGLDNMRTAAVVEADWAPTVT